MSLAKDFIEQTDPPRPPKETLPTMYDLPDEDPEEPGLPDEFHYLQPHLLSETFRVPNYSDAHIFTSGDLNLYYDVHHPLWHKRPDWFAVLGVPRLYENRDLRRSYVIWQEGVSPTVVVELLSPGTEEEDLGQTEQQEDTPPTKWQVYEQILRVSYYVVFDRRTNQLRVFQLVGGQYQQISLDSQLKVLMPTLRISLGLWQGQYRGIERLWLRWYDQLGNLILTEAEQQKQRAEQQQQRAERLAQRLRELGVDPEDI